MGATLKRFAWFMGIWAASVFAIVAVGGVIRLVLSLWVK